MSLYNMKSQPLAGLFTITKFDDDLNVESTYPYQHTTDGDICHCPAGQRPSCRHRQMFHQLVDRVDSAWMLDFDTRAWVDPTGEARATQELPELDDTEMVIDEMPDSLEKDELVLESSQPMPEPTTSIPDSHPFRRRM